MNTAYLPGFGDSATWPAYSGNPNDLRYVPDAEIDDRLWVAEEVDRLMASVRAELAKPSPMLARVDALFMEAANYLLPEVAS